MADHNFRLPMVCDPTAEHPWEWVFFKALEFSMFLLRSLITGRVVTSPGWMELAALHQRLAVGPTQMCRICHLQRH